MDIPVWKERLQELPLGDLHIYQELGSTNQLAEQLVQQGAPDFSLVIADAQSAGRGREGRSWTTIPGKSLAFSLILYPDSRLVEGNQLEKLSGLGALAVAEALSDVLGLEAAIKWPNDVLVGGKKVCGILVDLNWSGGDLKAAVLGIGINVSRGSVPDQELNFPATSLEEQAGREISRLDLLQAVLRSLLKWYPRLSAGTFLTAWEGYLAYKGEQVFLLSGGQVVDQGCLIGLSADGSLVIDSAAGGERRYRTGEIQLRLVDRS